MPLDCSRNSILPHSPISAPLALQEVEDDDEDISSDEEGVGADDGGGATAAVVSWARSGACSSLQAARHGAYGFVLHLQMRRVAPRGSRAAARRRLARLCRS